jgi:hypothetical protein
MADFLLHCPFKSRGSPSQFLNWTLRWNTDFLAINYAGCSESLYWTVPIVSTPWTKWRVLAKNTNSNSPQGTTLGVTNVHVKQYRNFRLSTINSSSTPRGAESFDSSKLGRCQRPFTCPCLCSCHTRHIKFEAGPGTKLTSVTQICCEGC